MRAWRIHEVRLCCSGHANHVGGAAEDYAEIVTVPWRGLTV